MFGDAPSNIINKATQMDRQNKNKSFFISLALAALTFALYCPVAHFNFINLDDPDYVTENGYVHLGLTKTSILWALRTGHAANWHPLTWWSHMLDVQCFGPGPAGPHLVNLA